MMDQLQRLKKIKSLINDLKNNFSRIENETNISLIEIDLLKNHTLNLYEELNKLSTGTPSEQRPYAVSNELDEAKREIAALKSMIGEGSKYFETHLEELRKIMGEAREMKNQPSPQEHHFHQHRQDQEHHTPISEHQFHKAPEEPVNEKHEPEDKNEDALNKKFGGHASLNDRFQGEKKSVLADKIKLTPINDLKSAINLNQKVAFIKELFGGDQKAYKKTIDFVNKCKNYSEAKFYVQSEIKAHHNWKEDEPLGKEFMDLVYRKFL